MRRRLLLFLPLLLLFAAGGLRLVAQQPGSAGADEEKKRQFLRAREEMHTVPATPSPNATPAPKPKPKIRPLAPPEPRPTPTPLLRPAQTPVPRPAQTPAPTRKPEPARPREHEREATPRPAAPRVTPPPATPFTIPSVRVTPAPAPVTVTKSGVEEERGLEPANSGGGWFTRWKYLSKSVRQEIDRAPVQRRRWRYIVVHNSGTRQGNAKAFEYYHLHVRKMPNGLAYHFVIGNGSSSGNGEIEIGNRWKRQINGGHVHSDYLNNIALGICLVGDFNRDTPSARQLASLDELIRYLRQRVGKIDREWAIVKAHRQINPPRWPTDCPGDRFPYSFLRKYD